MNNNEEKNNIFIDRLVKIFLVVMMILSISCAIIIIASLVLTVATTFAEPEIRPCVSTNTISTTITTTEMVTESSLTTTTLTSEAVTSIETEPETSAESTIISTTTVSDVISEEISLSVSEYQGSNYNNDNRIESINIDDNDELDDVIGADTINIDGYRLIKYSLPDTYYPSLDYSSFQPYMDYRNITNPDSAAYPVVYASCTYIDDNGLLRSTPDEDQFTLGEDDYVIGLGTYYKPKGLAGLRYLIVTSTGIYTAITGDEKADRDTDSHNMYSSHGDYGELGGLIEWIVDTNKLDKSVKSAGTVTAGDVEELKGEILYIYLIEE